MAFEEKIVMGCGKKVLYGGAEKALEGLVGRN
jgi:hypothetical protein